MYSRGIKLAVKCLFLILNQYCLSCLIKDSNIKYFVLSQFYFRFLDKGKTDLSYHFKMSSFGAASGSIAAGGQYGLI